MGFSTLNESDFNNIATSLNCEVAAIKAVCEIESSGKGFIEDGRPKILFEGHIFSKLTSKVWDEKYPNISYPKWDKSKYATGSTSEIRQLGEYNRLEQAKNLDLEAALKSTSWGMFQIMGFNYTKCSFKTVQDFVDAHYLNEASQLNCFKTFIQNNQSLLSSLQNKDWESFAKEYNGPGYKSNKYDEKLQNAYSKYVSSN